MWPTTELTSWVGDLETVQTLKSGGHLNVNHISHHFSSLVVFEYLYLVLSLKIRAIGCDIVFYSKKELLISMFGLRV